MSSSVIYVIRHGSTALNKEGGSGDSPVDKIRGHLNIPLSEKGRYEATETGKKLKNKGISSLYSSDLSRASETAQIIWNYLTNKDEYPDLPIKYDYGLRPWKLGSEIEGKETTSVLPKIKYYAENPNEIPPDGESFNSFKNRFFSTFDSIASQNKKKTVGIVTHYRGFKLLGSRKKGTNDVDLNKFLSFDDKQKPASVSIIIDEKLPMAVLFSSQTPTVNRSKNWFGISLISILLSILGNIWV